MWWAGQAWGEGHGKDGEERAIIPGSDQVTGQSTVTMVCGSLGRCPVGHHYTCRSGEGLEGQASITQVLFNRSFND